MDSNIEELIKLEIVCKRLRQQCLSRALWVAALETLEYRPPFIESRSILLDLSTADLRREIIKAIKLNRSWLSESGPEKTSEELIPVTDGVKRFDYIAPLPQVDLIIAQCSFSKIQCWCISQKKIVWEYVAQKAEDAEREKYIGLSLAYDVADDSATVTIALSFDRGIFPYQDRSIQVHQLNTRSFDCKLLYENPALCRPRTIARDPYKAIKKEYIVIKLYSDSEDGLLIFNWKDGTYVLIKGKMLRELDMTQEILFFVYLESTEAGFCLAGIRYRDLVGSSSTNPKDWPSYNVPADLDDRVEYSSIILPFEVSESDTNLEEIACTISAGVSSWSRSPSTRVTVTLGEFGGMNLDEFGRENDARNSIFDVEFKLGNDTERGVFTVLHEYHYDCDMDLYFRQPSLAIRSLIEEEEELPGTFAIAFGDNGNHYNRRNALEFFPADADESDISSIGIDSLGRMVVYELASESCATHIGVIRFD